MRSIIPSVSQSVQEWNVFSDLAVARCDCSVEQSVGRRCSSEVACRSRSFYQRKRKCEYKQDRCSSICYMNSVSLVSQGCRPRALLIGPMRMARLISDRLVNSTNTSIEYDKLLGKNASIYWCSNAQWCRLEWRPHRYRPAALAHTDRKSTRLNSSHSTLSRMPSSA